jgi:hypothetical protein
MLGATVKVLLPFGENQVDTRGEIGLHGIKSTNTLR